MVAVHSVQDSVLWPGHDERGQAAKQAISRLVVGLPSRTDTIVNRWDTNLRNGVDWCDQPNRKSRSDPVIVFHLGKRRPLDL